MIGLALPILLAIIGIIIAYTAYRNVRLGAVRYYTLEREALLQRASFTLIASVFFFLAAIALLIYNVQQIRIEGNASSDTTPIQNVPTATPEIVIFPPTPTPLPFVEPVTAPTIEPTIVIRRAVVNGTGTGVYLRDAPGGTQIENLDEGTTLSVLPDAPQEFNNFTWVRVRTNAGDEGWMADEFLIIRN